MRATRPFSNRWTSPPQLFCITFLPPGMAALPEAIPAGSPASLLASVPPGMAAFPAFPAFQALLGSPASLLASVPPGMAALPEALPVPVRIMRPQFGIERGSYNGMTGSIPHYSIIPNYATPAPRPARPASIRPGGCVRSGCGPGCCHRGRRPGWGSPRRGRRRSCRWCRS